MLSPFVLLFGRLCCSCPVYRRVALTDVAEHVVVARARVVVGHERVGVGVHPSAHGDIDAAAHALAGRAAGAGGSTGGAVFGDDTADERGLRSGVVIQAAPEAVAAIATFSPGTAE